MIKKPISNIKRLGLVLVAVLMFVSFFTLTENRSTLSAPIDQGPSILEAGQKFTDISKAKPVLTPHLKGGGDPGVGAGSYIIVDRETLTPILTKNASQKRSIASLTKLMTAVVALENGNLSDVVTVKNIKNAPASNMGLFVGEKITLENLLYGLLIPSANDSAEAVADYVGKGSYTAFVKKMNEKAKEIGMKDTHFTNAMGIDNPDNYSTAQDLIYLANYALKKDFIKNTVKIREKRIASVDGKSTYYLLSTDQLLGDPDINILGMKTGQTPMAGGCFIALQENPSGKEVLSVILGSYDRFGETKKVIQWSDENIVWE